MLENAKPARVTLFENRIDDIANGVVYSVLNPVKKKLKVSYAIGREG
jgi:hypothetical protein